MKKVRWGIISTGKIGMKQVIPAMQQGEFCEVVGIASRHLDAAKGAANELGIPKAYGSYEDLLADSEIDAIYNPLPNHLHVPWSIRALEAGKHVLCEKPIALSSAEAQTLVDAAQAHPRLKVMEAFMYRHHPQWQKAQKLVQGGKIGVLQTIQSFFSYHNVDPGNIRNQKGMGGGGLMDIGCYNISLSRFIFGKEPQKVCSLIKNDPEFNVDRMVSGMLDFGVGTASFTCSTQLSPYQRVNIFGTEGRIEIEIPFNAPIDRPCKMWHQTTERTEEIALETCNHYTIQGDLFSQAILNNAAVPTPLEDAVANMKVLEALVKSSEIGQWV